MLLLWVSSQSFTQDARTSLATINFVSASTWFARSNDGDTKRKTIYYMLWNGHFFIRYNGYLIVFRHDYQPGESNSREEISLSCFGRST